MVYKQIAIIIIAVQIIGCTAMQADWEVVQSKDEMATNREDQIALYEDYLRKYPNSKYAIQAHMRLDWLYYDKYCRSNSKPEEIIITCEKFLQKYPDPCILRQRFH